MTWAKQLADALLDSLTTIGTQIGLIVPRILAMILILLLGYLVARLLRKVAVILLRRVGFERASRNIGVASALEQAQVHLTATDILGKLVFWFFMLTFAISAVEALGLENVSETIRSVVAYLPHVIGAAVILVVGMLLAHFVRDLVRGGLDRLEVDYAQPVATIVHLLVIVIIASVAVSQLQIETQLINQVIQVVLLTGGGALALGLGLGSRDVARNIVAGVYARDLYEPGTTVAVGGADGRLEEVGTVNARIRAGSGEAIYVPNAQLLDSVVRSGHIPPA